jgi:hypothetical protein
LIPEPTENVRISWRKKYKDKAPSVHLWTEFTKEPSYGREINQLSRRLTTNSILLLAAIPFFSVKWRYR